MESINYSFIKRLATLILVLAVPFSSICQANSEYRESKFLHDAYMYFSEGDFVGTISEMKHLGMKLEKKSAIKIEPSGTIDSLVFVGDSASAILSVVDLGYLKVLSGTIQISSNQPDATVDSLANLFASSGYTPEKEFVVSGFSATFMNKGDHWVVDRRFVKPSYTNFLVLYQHTITRYGNQVVMDMQETIPKEWIDGENFLKVSPQKTSTFCDDDAQR